MQAMQALDIVFQPMALAPKTFPVGSTIRVTVAFRYTAGAAAVVRLLAGPYYTNVLGRHMVDPCVASIDLPLAAALTPAEKTATVDFLLIPKAQGGIDNGTYGLRVWVEGTNADVAQDNVLIVAGNAGGLLDTLSAMMPLLMMFLMMGMVMPMLQGMGGGAEK